MLLKVKFEVIPIEIMVDIMETKSQKEEFIAVYDGVPDSNKLFGFISGYKQYKDSLYLSVTPVSRKKIDQKYYLSPYVFGTHVFSEPYLNIFYFTLNNEQIDRDSS
jgi:hypothetical protein